MASTTMNEKTGPYEVREQTSDDSLSDGIQTGVAQDANDMYRLGRKQELMRNFSWLSTLGLAGIIMDSWSATLATSFFSLVNGGYAGSVWVYLAVTLCTITIVASLAEMASMAPTSAGQYHWVSEFSPPSCQKFLSYVVGWLTVMGYQALIAITAYTCGSVILETTRITNPDYIPLPWHGTVMTIVVVLIVTVWNIFGAKYLPAVESFVMFLNVVGFFATIIPLWILADKPPAKTVFTEFSNFGGWASVGSACLIGQLTSSSALACADAPVHLSEEIRNASKVVPKVMIWTVIASGITGWVMMITMCFNIQSIEDQVLGYMGAYPFVGIFANTLGPTGATILCVVQVLTAFFCCLTALATASRQAWSLGRDDGLPFSSWFKKVSNIGTPIPVNAIAFSLFIPIVLSLLNLGGTAAFNSIQGLLTGAGGMSYIVSISTILLKRLRGEPLPPARWSLGKLGLPINAFALCYSIEYTIMSFFPLFNHPDAKSMNWGIAMFGGMSVIAMVNYAVWGRKVYKGPVTLVKQI